MKKTFKEIIESNGGIPLEFSIQHESGTIEAGCWTDDPEVLEWDASFSVDCSWQRDGGIGRYDNLHGELDVDIMRLCKMIEDRIGGKWFYSPSDAAIVQGE